MQIKKIKLQERGILYAEFVNGEIKRYSMGILTDELPVFSKLIADENLFSNGHISSGGYAVIWNGEIDLAAEEIYERGETIEGFPA